MLRRKENKGRRDRRAVEAKILETVSKEISIEEVQLQLPVSTLMIRDVVSNYLREEKC